MQNNSKQQLNSNLNWTDAIQEHATQKKFKKFFRITIPILVIEIVAIIALGVYWILLPKNFCYIHTNRKDAVIYINDEKINKFRFNVPDEDLLYYNYKIDVEIELPSDDSYTVSFTIECNKYQTFISTPATKSGDTYILEVQGGVKTQLISSITFRSETKLKNVNVNININIDN